MDDMARNVKLARQTDLLATPSRVAAANLSHRTVCQRGTRVPLPSKYWNMGCAMHEAVGHVLRMRGPAQVGDRVVVAIAVGMRDFVQRARRRAKKSQRNQAMDAGLESLRAKLYVPVAISRQPRLEHMTGSRVANGAETADLVAGVAWKRTPLAPCRHV